MNQSSATYCEDCGCKVYSGRCTNCHEELYIMDQYYELAAEGVEIEFPKPNSEFMQKVREQENQIASKP